MNEPLKNENQELIITDFLRWAPWEWFISLNIEDGSTLEKLEWMLKKWRRSIFNAARGTLIYQGVLVHGDSTHAHILAMSKPNSTGATLGSLSSESIKAIEDRWFQLAGRPADIRPVSSPEGIAGYLACRKNMGGSKWELINPCGIKTLKHF